MAPRRRGRGEREAWFLAVVLIIALRHIATQCRVLINHGHRLGKMKHVHVLCTLHAGVGGFCSICLLCSQPCNHADSIASSARALLQTSTLDFFISACTMLLTSVQSESMYVVALLGGFMPGDCYIAVSDLRTTAFWFAAV